MPPGWWPSAADNIFPFGIENFDVIYFAICVFYFSLFSARPHYSRKYQIAIMLFTRNLPTRCHKTSLRAFISWIAGISLELICRMLCAYSIVLSQYTSITLPFQTVFNGGWSSMSLYNEKGLIGAPTLKPEMWADTPGKALSFLKGYCCHEAWQKIAQIAKKNLI